MGNRMGIEWSYDQRRHVTLKGQAHDANTLGANISKTAGDAI